jgi:hypothetical protein
MQRAEAHRQNINRERARLTEMQYNLDIFCQQGHEAPLHNQILNQPPPPSSPHNQIPHHPHQPPPPQNHMFQPPLPPQMGTIDPKSPLDEHLQHAPWPLHYRAVTPPKYHGNTDPHKFFMCYEAAIASAGGDEATLAKILDHLLGGCGHKLVFQATSALYLLMAASKRQDPPQLSRVPSGA